MDIIVYICCLLAGGLTSLLWRPAHQIVTNLAKTYAWLIALSVVSSWIFHFAGIKNESALGIIGSELTWADILAHLILGYLITRIALDLEELPGNAVQLRATFHIVLWTTSISYANTFILVTVGKYTHLSEMTSFFRQSGYSVWFLYFIMAAETLGAIGVLSHFRWRTGIRATIGLSLIMLGAIYTHWHNDDPFSDSYEAVIQLIAGLILLTLYFLQKALDNHAKAPRLRHT